MSSPSSLRDSYINPIPGWHFSPLQKPRSPPVNITASSLPASSPQWSTRPAHSSIFDLSPDLNNASGVNAGDLLRAIAASAMLQYTSTAIAMPWEVGKLLLQVQWVPRYTTTEADATADGNDNDEDEMSDSSNDVDNESYFADPESTPRMLPSRVDSQGYDIHGLEASSEYAIPVGSASGVWGMIKRVGRFRGEGWLALWKGLLTSFCTEMTSSTIQPIILGLLRYFFLPSTALFYHPPILMPIASHLLTGFLLSPLDLIRTRLIVQSFSQHHRRYTGPIDALKQILIHEGGLKGIYLHPHLLIPCLIDNALRPVVSLALPGLLVGYLGAHITENSNPIAWGLAELAGSCIGLLVTLPFETVRRRLQVQVRGDAKPIKGCVQLRPVPYHGVIDTLWHILTEERSDLPVENRVRTRQLSRGAVDVKGKGKERAVPEHDSASGGEYEDTWTRRTGLGQLYRGLGMRLGASAIVFILALISGSDDSNGWAEL